MRPALLLLPALALAGCDGSPAPRSAEAPATYSADVRRTFLDACLDNARNVAGAAASDAQLERTCDCILGRVEQEYGQAEFAAFEQRLLGGTASDQESRRLVRWSDECAQTAAR